MANETDALPALARRQSAFQQMRRRASAKLARKLKRPSTQAPEEPVDISDPDPTPHAALVASTEELVEISDVIPTPVPAVVDNADVASNAPVAVGAEASSAAVSPGRSGRLGNAVSGAVRSFSFRSRKANKAKSPEESSSPDAKEKSTFTASAMKMVKNLSFSKKRGGLRPLDVDVGQRSGSSLQGEPPSPTSSTPPPAPPTSAAAQATATNASSSAAPPKSILKSASPPTTQLATPSPSSAHEALAANTAANATLNQPAISPRSSPRYPKLNFSAPPRPASTGNVDGSQRMAQRLAALDKEQPGISLSPLVDGPQELAHSASEEGGWHHEY